MFRRTIFALGVIFFTNIASAVDPVAITLDTTGASTGSVPSTIYLKYGEGWYSNASATTPISSLTRLPTSNNRQRCAGFYTGQNGTGTKIIDSLGNILTTNAVLTFTDTPTTIYAYWLDEFYIVKFDKNGGEGGTDALYFDNSEVYTDETKRTAWYSGFHKIAVPTRPGYVFVGYYNDDDINTNVSVQQIFDGVGNDTSAHIQVNHLINVNDGDKTLYAHWADEKFSLGLSQTNTFDIRISAAGTFYVDCGNGGTLSGTGVSGNEITRNSTSSLDIYTCTWPESGVQTVKMAGLATDYSSDSAAITFYNQQSTNSSKIASVYGSLGAIFPSVGNKHPRFNGAFGYASMSSIPETLFSGVTGATGSMFDGTFEACENLTSIPGNLFSGINGVAARMFASTFVGCTGLTAIPATLFSKVNGLATSMFNGTFAQCTGLTSIPENLFASVTGGAEGAFQGTFAQCTGLTSIPKNLFKGVTIAAQSIFDRVFVGCNNLTGYIPATTFSGLVANGSPTATDMWDAAFSGTSLATSCPAGTVEYDTGYESYWNNVVSCVPITTIAITLNNTAGATVNVAPRTVYLKYGTEWTSDSAGNVGIDHLTTLPSKTGFEFGGFFTGQNGTGTQIIDASGNLLKTAEALKFTIEPKTVHALFRDAYQVTYSCGTGSGTPPESVTAASGVAFTPALSNGCTNGNSAFAGWLVSGTSDVVDDTFIWNYAENKTLTAQWLDNAKFILTTISTDSFEFKMTAKGNFTVDCGDGGTLSGTGVSGNTITRNDTNEATYTCTYGDVAEHEIKFGGQATGYRSNSNIPAITFYNASANPVSLVKAINGSLGAIFPNISNNTGNAYNPVFAGTFHGAQITTIPSSLFSGISRLRQYMFQQTFMGCTNLTKIPENLFVGITTPSGTNYTSAFVQTFQSCTGLTSIPAGLFSNVTELGDAMFSSTFNGCSGITEIEGNLFGLKANSVSKSAVSAFENTFKGCKFTSIPEGLFSGVSGSANRMFNGTFMNDTSLTSIPAGLFSGVSGAAEREFENTFSGCTNLNGKYIPSTTFSGLIANSSPTTTDMWKNTFYNTGLVTTCPTGTTDYYTGYKGEVNDGSTVTWNGRVSCVPKTAYTVLLSSGNVNIPSTPSVVYLDKNVGWYSDETLTTPIYTVSVPMKQNHEFLGFFTGQSGAGTQIIDSVGQFLTTPDALSFVNASVSTIYPYFKSLTEVTLNTSGADTGVEPSKIYLKYDAGWYADAFATTNSNISYLTTLPTKAGGTFAGFYTAPDGGGMQIIDASGKILTTPEVRTFTNARSQTIYAYFGSGYTVNYSCGARATGTPPSSGVAVTGTAFTPASPTNCVPPEDYYFVGWAVSGTDDLKHSTFTWDYDENKTLTAQWAKVSFSVTTTALSKNTTFKFHLSAAGNFSIDWGDDNVEVLEREDNTERTEYSHTYDKAGTYKINFTGAATAYNTANNVGVLSFYEGTPHLVARAEGTLGRLFPVLEGQVPRFFALFRDCEHLESIPADLFKGIYTVTPYMFADTFRGCTALTSIPSGLFTHITGSAEGLFYETFYGCTGLSSSIPANLFAGVNGAAKYMFYKTFYNTGNLQSYIPPALFDGLKRGEAYNMMYETFHNSGIAVSCAPYELLQYYTGYESDWEGHVSCKEVSLQYPFTLTTTDLNPNDTFAFTMSAAGKYVVDWGDGNIEVIDRTDDTDTTTYSHTYTTGGVKTIGLYGKTTEYNTDDDYGTAIAFGPGDDSFFDETTPDLVASVSGSLGAIFPTLGNAANQQPMFLGTFYGCTNLTSVPEELFTGVTGATNYMFYQTFMNSGLTEIPEGLFAGVNGAATGMFYQTFAESTGLTSVPDNLFAGVNGAADQLFQSTFEGCTGLMSISGNLFVGVSGSAASLFDSTFTGCTSLTSLPGNLFAGVNGTATSEFASTFSGCTSLSGYIPSTTFSGLIANSSPTTTNMWYNTFNNTGLVTTCPTGTTDYTTGYEGSTNGNTWNGKVSCTTTTPVTVTLNDVNATTHVNPGTVYLLSDTGWYSNYTTTTEIDSLTTVPAKTNKGFNGFFTGQNGTGIQVIDRDGNFIDTEAALSFTTNLSATVYADWHDTYTVTYSCGEGSGTPPANGIALYGATFKPAILTCSKAGSMFAGWAVSDTPDVKTGSFKWNYASDKTLTAQWAPAKFSLTTTNLSAGAEFVFGMSAKGNFVVDWGDGTIDVLDRKNTEYQYYRHTYATAGAKTISFSGTATGYSVSETMGAAITFGYGTEAVEEYYYPETTPGLIASISGSLGSVFPSLPGDTPDKQPRFIGTFDRAENLTGIPFNLFDGVRGHAPRMFYRTFARCSLITSIPENLFADISGADKEMFYNTFGYWFALGSDPNIQNPIPETLFEGISGAAEAMFRDTFTQCNQIKTIPANLFAGVSGKAPYLFAYTFSRNFSLQSIPGALFAGVRGAAEAMFLGTFVGQSGVNHSLTSIPENLFAGVSGAAPQMFMNTFEYLNNLGGALPDNLFIGVSGAADQMFYGTFAYTAITSIPNTLFKNVQSSGDEMFAATFRGCSNIRSIPEDLFAKVTSNGESVFYNTFYDCTSLESIPEKLFRSVSGNKTQTFRGTFRNTAIRSIPENLFNPPTKVRGAGSSMFRDTFYDCKNLTSIPENLFAGISGKNSYLFANTFRGCTSLTSIPEKLFSGVTGGATYMFYYTFYGCTGLTSIPNNLFAGVSASATSMFANVFSGCTKLAGYIPPSTFRGLINAGSPTTTNMWANAFKDSKLATSCPSGTTLISTAYHGSGSTKWNGKVSCKPSSIITITLDDGDATDNVNPGTVYLNYAQGWYSDSEATTSISSVTVPTKTGREFMGFYTGQNGTGYQVINANGVFSTNVNVLSFTTKAATLYAYWPETFNVTYSCGEGTGTPPASGTATYGKTLKDSENTCSKDGYLFAGWAVSGTNDLRGENFVWNYKENKTLTAQWSNSEGFTITTTNIPAKKSFIFGMSAAGVFTVVWGDGKTETLDRFENVDYTVYSHNYDKAGVRNIKIIGTTTLYSDGSLTPAITFGPGGDRMNFSGLTPNYVAGVYGSLATVFPKLGGTWITNPRFMGTFSNCTKLTSVPESLFAYPAGTKLAIQNTFYRTFAKSGLTSIPGNLFVSAGVGQSLFEGTFQETPITEVPKGLFATIKGTAASMFYRTFRACPNLKTISEGAFALSGTAADSAFYQTFYNSSNIEEIPDGLFAGLRGNAPSLFYQTFYGLNKITSIPDNLFADITGNAENMFYHTFALCSSITEIPENLFAGVTGAAPGMFRNTFNSAAISTIPESLFSGVYGAAENMFYYTFKGCSNLTSIPEGLFAGVTGGAPGMFGYTFQNCTSLTDIPKNLFANVNQASTGMFQYTFDGCSSLGSFIPPSTFRGLIEAESPTATDMWNNTFTGTNLATSCDAYNLSQYITGYEGDVNGTTWNGKVACGPMDSCTMGQYLDSQTNECVSCAVGSYNDGSSANANACTPCPGGRTTSGTGKAVCDVRCPNVSGVKTWVTPTWNSDNTVSDSCVIDTCAGNFFPIANDAGNTCMSCSVATSGTYPHSSADGIAVDDLDEDYDGDGRRACYVYKNEINGSHISAIGDLFVSACPAGSYSSYPAKQEGAGEETIADQKIYFGQQYDCSSCPANSYSTGGATECSACVQGYTTNGDRTSPQSCRIRCEGGYIIQNANDSTCSPVGAGNYAEAAYVSQGNTSRYESCPTGQTNIGYGVGADEAGDCGRILHVGEYLMYLRSDRKTEHTLNAKIGDDIFYGNMSTEDIKMSNGMNKYFKVMFDNAVYSVYDDSGENYVPAEE